MATIHVPRPKRSSMNPTRRASSLLLTQAEHMHSAEKRLPHRYRTEIYVNAIKTEGEAAEYIARVTAAINRAHGDAEKRRLRAIPKSGRVLKIAAAAEKKPTSVAKKKSSAVKDSAARGKSKTRRKK